MLSRWECEDEFYTLAKRADTLRDPKDSNQVVLIAAFSIGLTKDGFPTVANQEIVHRAVEMCHVPALCCQNKPPTIMFCTGTNQPVGVSSALAMCRYAKDIFPSLAPDSIVLDTESIDTSGNAKAVVKYISMHIPRGTRVLLGLVCHPLHMRRSMLCLRQELKRAGCILDTYQTEVEIFRLPADYGRNQTTRHIEYEPTPGHPWLQSHWLYLVYEVLAYFVAVCGLQGLLTAIKSALLRTRSTVH